MPTQSGAPLQAFDDLLARIYEKWAPTLLKEAVEYFDKTPDPIPAAALPPQLKPLGYTDDAIKYALLPILGKGNPRIQELYRKLFGTFPLDKMKVFRSQAEDPLMAGSRNALISHKSRGGGIFVGLDPTTGKSLMPSHIRQSGGLHHIEKEVQLTNPIVIPHSIHSPGSQLVSTNNPFSEGVLMGPAHIANQRNPSRISRYANTRGALRKQVGPNKESSYHGDFMVTPDADAARLAKHYGFDAIIPATTQRALDTFYSGMPQRNPIAEMILIPPKKTKGNYSIWR